MLGGEVGCFRCSSLQRHGGKPCSLGCGFATRGLLPGLFSNRFELFSPVVFLLGPNPAFCGFALCLLCSGLELRHLLPCRFCVRTSLLRGAFCLRCGGFVLGGEVGCFRCSGLQRRNAPALLGLLEIQFGFRFHLRLRFFWHG